jgi:hypothetical protein
METLVIKETLGRSLVALCVLAAICTAWARAQDANGATSKPAFRLTDVQGVYSDRTLSDVEIVRRLALMLDDRISIRKRDGLPASDADSGREVGLLVRLIPERPYPDTPKERPEIVQSVIGEIEQAKALVVANPDELIPMLYVSRALAGVAMPADMAASLLEREDVPRHVKKLALDGMATTEVPPATLPTLLKLIKDDWSYTNIVTDVGDGQRGKRVFPIRSSAAACLKKLGIALTLSQQGPHPSTAPTARLHPDGKPMRPKLEFPPLEVTVDSESLSTLVDRWLRDADEQKWRAAIAVLQAGGDSRLAEVRARVVSDPAVPGSRRELLRDNK